MSARISSMGCLLSWRSRREIQKIEGHYFCYFQVVYAFSRNQVTIPAFKYELRQFPTSRLARLKEHRRKEKMETKQKIELLLFAMLGSLLMVATSGATEHTCGGQRTINDALRRLRPGTALLVSGTYNENVVIEEQIQNVTLDGRGVATVSGPDTTAPSFTIRGRGITIKGFTITGGENAITVTR